MTGPLPLGNRKNNGKAVRNILMGWGLMFLVAGIYGVANPDFASNLLRLDAATGRIVSGVVALIGITDILLSKFVFGRRKSL